MIGGNSKIWRERQNKKKKLQKYEKNRQIEVVKNFARIREL